MKADPLQGATIRVVDVAAQAREMFGEKAAAEIAGRPLPEHDYRFEVIEPSGAQVTCSRETTAAELVAYMEARR